MLLFSAFISVKNVLKSVTISHSFKSTADLHIFYQTTAKV